MFEISIMERDYDLNDPEGETGFFNSVARKLVEFEQELERNNYIEAVARRYGIGYEDLRKLVNHYGLSGYGQDGGKNRMQIRETLAAREAKKGDTAKEDAVLTSQKLLLTWLIDDVTLFGKIKPFIGPDRFQGTGLPSGGVHAV